MLTVMSQSFCKCHR